MIDVSILSFPYTRYMCTVNLCFLPSTESEWLYFHGSGETSNLITTLTLTLTLNCDA